MFMGGPPKRPDKESAYKQLRQHLTVLGVWFVVIRLTPYVLQIQSSGGLLQGEWRSTLLFP
eukprot:jgi/Mesen1/7847/ME000419S07158